MDRYIELLLRIALTLVLIYIIVMMLSGLGVRRIF